MVTMTTVVPPQPEPTYTLAGITEIQRVTIRVALRDFLNESHSRESMTAAREVYDAMLQGPTWGGATEKV